MLMELIINICIMNLMIDIWQYCRQMNVVLKILIPNQRPVEKDD